MARTFKNSTVVRALHLTPTEHWFDHLDALSWAVACAAEGEVDTVSGPLPAEVDWLFELESDAAWFLLKHGGRIVNPNEVCVKSLMIGLG